MKLKRILALSLTVLLTLTSLSAIVIPAGASIKPNYSAYTFSEAYKASNYYQNLKAVKLTGDHRYDVVAVALSQLGYHEGSSEADMDGWNLTSDGNFVEYNRLFCKLYNSSTGKNDYGYAWCAAFASWCQYMAGVPADIDCSEVSCPRMINEILKPQNLYKDKSAYTPICGDLIYFKDSGSNVSTHVGIVIGVKDGYVYTIEGNANNCVCQKKYALSDSYIMGYGALKYKTIAGTDYSSFPLTETELLKPGKYKITASTLNVRQGPGTSHAILGALAKNDEVEILEIDGSWGKINYKGKSGWISTSYIASTEKSVFTITFNANTGSFKLDSQRKIRGIDTSLTTQAPIKEGSLFLGWSESKDGEVAYKPGDKITEDKDLTLYAVWEKEKYTIRFIDYDGRVISSEVLEYGTQITPPTPPVRESDGEYAYEFKGWDRKPIYAVDNTDYTATYSSRELTEEEKAALTATDTSNDDNAQGGCNATLPTLLAPLFALATVATVFDKKKRQ